MGWFGERIDVELQGKYSCTFTCPVCETQQTHEDLDLTNDVIHCSKCKEKVEVRPWESWVDYKS